MELIAVLVAVIIGYLLGVAPFVIPKLLEMKSGNVEMSPEKEKEQQEIIDEWLNGPKNNINQEDIYNEYVTGKETVKGD